MRQLASILDLLHKYSNDVKIDMDNAEHKEEYAYGVTLGLEVIDALCELAQLQLKTLRETPAYIEAEKKMEISF
jgi:hypothetical protein